MVTTRQWIRGLLYPDAAIRGLPFGTGARLPCLGCAGDHNKLQDLDDLQNTSGLSGPMMSVRLRDRLSVSVYATRRGTNSDHTRALERTSFYDCLFQSRSTIGGQSLKISLPVRQTAKSAGFSPSHHPHRHQHVFDIERYASYKRIGIGRGIDYARRER
jgi:hypothetical protein